MVEKITHQNLSLGIIIRNNFSKNGIEFFTNDNDNDDDDKYLLLKIFYQL